MKRSLELLCSLIMNLIMTQTLPVKLLTSLMLKKKICVRINEMVLVLFLQFLEKSTLHFAHFP